ncbi:hypothetical protein AAFO92_09770 [Roseovarius sp. CAU 1744]|uniref:hypothetical protein n=1 Tax=Roseovarius sp. CAU 1744 TaxID=3140368 RepID=UPI00325B73F4
MGFKYDFDMFSTMPDEVRQEFQGMLNDIGLGAIGTEQKALFRDPALVDALSGADEQVRNLFLASGFGLNVYDSGAPDGRYPGHDEEARNACVRKLAENVATAEGLTEANWNGFDIGGFLDYLAVARPMDEIEMQAIAKAQATGKRKSSLLRLGLVAGAAMVTISTVGILLGTLGS